MDRGQIEYQLERSSKRRRTIAIHIKNGEVVVRAPQRAARARIDEIVAGKAAWIAKQLLENEARDLLTARGYTDGELFKFLGRDYPLTVNETAAKRIKPATFAGGCIAVGIPTGQSGEERSEWARESLTRWYRPRAKSHITKQVSRWAATTGLVPKLVRVKDLKRSWGICTQENISLSWRLIMAPAPLIEYVVIHELCHLKHKNHSPAFYATLASFMPDYKERRRALKQLAPFLKV
ncbi:MAG: SprT family zinc-dependent metalloprotease [Actinomycetota bacterium]|nr:SprT family zinc-dependent metalloprotease [Actinomycetota bacterium]